MEVAGLRHSQSEGQELSNLRAAQGWAGRRGQGTHAGNGILQQELGPLAPRSLLLLELPREEAANRTGRE